MLDMIIGVSPSYHTFPTREVSLKIRRSCYWGCDFKMHSSSYREHEPWRRALHLSGSIATTCSGDDTSLVGCGSILFPRTHVVKYNSLNIVRDLWPPYIERWCQQRPILAWLPDRHARSVCVHNGPYEEHNVNFLRFRILFKAKSVSFFVAPVIDTIKQFFCPLPCNYWKLWSIYYLGMSRILGSQGMLSFV